MSASRAGIRIAPGDGPRVAPVDRPGRGLVGAGCLRYEVDPGARGACAVIAETDHPIAPGDELRVALFPECGGALGDAVDWRATYVAVRVRFADGGVVDDELLDQDGVPSGPRAQGDSATLPPFQWTLKRFDLTPWGGRTVTAVELVASPPELPGATGPIAGWVEPLGVAPAVAREEDPIAWVDTRRGSRSGIDLSRGNTVPIVGRPHGGVFAIPVTDAARDDWLYTWAAEGLEALAVSSIPSPWIGERGGLQVFFAAPDGSADPAGRRRAFAHDDERAGPDEYAVRFADGSAAAARTTGHAVEIELRDPRGIPAIVLAPQGGGILRREDDTDGRAAFSARIAGASRASADAPARYVRIELDAPVRSASGHVVVLADGATRVRVRIGCSYAGVDAARERLRTEMPWTRSSAALREESRSAWRPLLASVEAEGIPAGQRLALTSSVARMHVYPNDVDEVVDGRLAHVDAVTPAAGPDDERRTGRRIRPGGAMANTGFWDTYRTVWPWFALRDPEHAAAMFDGFVAHGVDGGWMPRWSAPGCLDAMVGTSSDVVAATILQALPEWEGAETAYDLAVRNATVPSDDPAVGRRGLARSRFTGWVDDAIGESVSWTLEGATCDAAIAGMARALHARDPRGPRAAEYLADAAYFDQRAHDHLTLFDSDTGFYRGRDAGGRFADGFDPRRWGGDYTETNAWGTAFSAPHDLDGLVAAHGGPEGLGRRLDAFFATPETGDVRWRGSYPGVIHEMTEARNVRMGMFGLSNQPAHHIPFVYAASDRPWRTHELVGTAVRTRFTGSDAGAGYPGDEDDGELSAWYVLASLGLYPFMPGGDWLLTAPSVPSARVRRARGDLLIETRGDPRHEPYVQGVDLDGEPWDSAFLPHAMLDGGARLAFRLGGRPSAWGRRDPGPAPAPRRDLTRGARVSGVPGAHVLVDDRGRNEVVLGHGDACAIEPVPPRPAAVYTLTAARAGVHRWRLHIDPVGGSEIVADLEARWDRAGRTRAFGLPPGLPAGAAAVRRLTIEGAGPAGIPLTQIELLEDSECQR